MIKMSDFLQKTKIVIKDGETELIKPVINGEIEINEFDSEVIERIQKEVLNKITDEQLKNDKYFTYRIFPYIAKVEMDIKYEDFLKLVEKPKRPFSLLLEMVTDEMNEMFESAKDVSRINDKVIAMRENNKDLFNNPENIKEEEINKLMIELQKNYTDKEKRDEILNQINKIREM